MRYFVLVDERYNDVVSLPILEEFAKITEKSEDERWYELITINQETFEREE